MMRRVHGTSAFEYVVLIVSGAMALVVCFGLVRNAVSHRFKSGADGIGHGMRYP